MQAKKKPAKQNADKIVVNPKTNDKDKNNPASLETDTTPQNQALAMEHVLTVQQRMKRAAIFRRLQPKLKMMRALAKKRMASPEKLQTRAENLARRIVKKRYAGMRGFDYANQTTGTKMAIDKQVVGKHPLVKAIARRLLPKVRQAEVLRFGAIQKGKSVNVSPFQVGKGNFAGRGTVDAAMGKGVNFSEATEINELSKALLRRYIAKAGQQRDVDGSLKRVKGINKAGFKKADYGESVINTLMNKAIDAGIDHTILEQVFQRGWDAWNDTKKVGQQEYAFNRVNSFLSGGLARDMDIDLVYTNEEFKPGDTVHAGFKVKGGAGFKGKVIKTEGDWVHINIGTSPGSKFGDRTIKAHKSVVSEAWVVINKDLKVIHKGPTSREAMRVHRANPGSHLSADSGFGGAQAKHVLGYDDATHRAKIKELIHKGLQVKESIIKTSTVVHSGSHKGYKFDITHDPKRLGKSNAYLHTRSVNSEAYPNKADAIAGAKAHIEKEIKWGHKPDIKEGALEDAIAAIKAANSKKPVEKNIDPQWAARHAANRRLGDALMSKIKKMSDAELYAARKKKVNEGHSMNMLYLGMMMNAGRKQKPLTPEDRIKFHEKRMRHHAVKYVETKDKKYNAASHAHAEALRAWKKNAPNALEKSKEAARVGKLTEGAIPRMMNFRVSARYTDPNHPHKEKRSAEIFKKFKVNSSHGDNAVAMTKKWLETKGYKPVAVRFHEEVELTEEKHTEQATHDALLKAGLTTGNHGYKANHDPKKVHDVLVKHGWTMDTHYKLRYGKMPPYTSYSKTTGPYREGSAELHHKDGKVHYVTFNHASSND